MHVARRQKAEALDDVFLHACLAVSGLDDTTTVASVCDALLASSIFTADDMESLQQSAKLPGSIDSSVEQEAFVRAAGLLLRYPFLLVHTLGLANLVHHQRCIGRCVMLEVRSCRGGADSCHDVVTRGAGEFLRWRASMLLAGKCMFRSGCWRPDQPRATDADRPRGLLPYVVRP